jgi:hypothetical protein
MTMPIIVDNQQRIIRVKSEDEKTVATIKQFPENLSRKGFAPIIG